MPLFDDIRAHGAAYRLTEEALYAEALREVEAGIRRDGLWAKALVTAGGAEAEAKAIYIKLRVRSLRDEATLYLREVRQAKEEHTLRLQRVDAAQALQPRPLWRRIARRILNGFMLFGLLLWISIMVFGGVMELIKR